MRTQRWMIAGLLIAAFASCATDNSAAEKVSEDDGYDAEKSMEVQEKENDESAVYDDMDAGPQMDPEDMEMEVELYTRPGRWVPVPGDMTLCEKDADCALVETSCDGCCSVGAISAASRKAFAPLKEAACKATASEAACDCEAPAVASVCDNYRGQCVLVPSKDPKQKEADRDCFSPYQNVESAYDGVNEGCACKEDQGVCIAGAALVCADKKWTAVQDGPCESRPGDAQDSCSAGEVYARAEDCLSKHPTCQLGEDGFFCGLD